MKAGTKFPAYNGMMSVKSKYMAEFRRFSLSIEDESFEKFLDQIKLLHEVGANNEIVLTYTDPVHGDLLPINNDENFSKAKQSCANSHLMKVYIHKKDNYIVSNGYGSNQRRRNKKKPVISLPADFRPVSAIIDVDILPETLRRVRLHNPGGNKLLGFYIRDSVRLHVDRNGGKAERVPGISIHRLVPGGLAEMTGLLAVDDEILEVNGIEVAGKSLDQVTDMMIANSANLVVTVRPASSLNIPSSVRASFMRHSSPGGQFAAAANAAATDDEEAEDLVEDLSAPQPIDDSHKV